MFKQTVYLNEVLKSSENFLYSRAMLIKELIRPIISNWLVNRIAFFVLKHVRFIVPVRLLVRVPLNGIAECKISKSKKLRYYSNADDPIAPGLFFNGLKEYEPETIELFLTLARQSQTIFDIGANTGIYALIAAIENSSSTVHAFEPLPRVFQRLEYNRTLNQAHNLELSQYGISDSSGMATLFVPIGTMPTSSSIQKGHRRAVETVEIKTITIDSYVINNNIQKLDLIKIDTETTEPAVLKGGLRTISRDKPTIICEVLHPEQAKLINEILDDLGYLYFWINSDGLVKNSKIVPDKHFNFLNHLFIHEDYTKRLKGIAQIKREN